MLTTLRAWLLRLILITTMVATVAFAQQDRRVALVIGNAAYLQGALANPINDARAIAGRLRTLGFEVILKENLKTREIGGVYREFRSKVTPGSVALVFYAGHGLQIRGQNYFPAVDSEISSEEDVPLQSLNLSTLIDNMEEAKAGVSLVFLDACRDNPFARRFRSSSRGLAKVEVASGTLIHYATKPGSVASDGDGKNGIYTDALLSQMSEAGVPVEQMLKRVANRVVEKTKGRQEPWVEGSLRGDFFFVFQGPTSINVQAPFTNPETEAWKAAESVNQAAAFQAYLDAYPSGSFAPAARIKLSALQKAAAPATTAPLYYTGSRNSLPNQATGAQRNQLLVYTSLETDQMKAYEQGFNKEYPDIEIKWVRDSTGVIATKLFAEKDNPQADVVMGVAASTLAILDANEMLFPYAPSNLALIDSKYRDRKNPPAWFGMDIWGATVCFNSVEAANKRIQKPESWQDLAKPIYKGQIVMPNPVSSGTGYLDVNAWLTIWGEADGWTFMDRLHENIAQYTHSGSKPCTLVANGQYLIGISFESRASILKSKGAPIDLVFPKEGLGWDMEGFAIHSRTKKLAAAKKLAEWTASRNAALLFGKNFAVTAMPGAASVVAHLPGDYESRLINLDFSWVANNRTRILSEWNRRYDSKTEPR